MNSEQLAKKLLNKRGYLKKGVGYIASAFHVNKEVAYEALQIAKAEVNSSNKDEVSAKVIKSKKWQLPNGEWRESIQYDHKSSNEEFIKLKQEILSSLEGINKPIEVSPVKENQEKVYIEVSLPDFHFGKVTGETLIEQQHLFVEALYKLMDKASGFSISRIILPIGNDLMNSEGLRRSTTKGTPQEDNETWQITFRAALHAVIAGINYLKTIAPVDVIFVGGNHDYERCFYLGEAVVAFFHDDPRVLVDNSFEHRKYYVGDNFILGYTHGDTEKPYDLPLIMATEKPVEFANNSHRFWRLGHLHKHMLDEYRGVQVEFLPSLCASDDWHKRMGYYSNRKALATIFTSEGKEGYIQLNKN